MFIGMAGKRSYRMTERARSQAETRLRIVEATMRLHETLGPKDTTISAIAREAGVQRLTIYRHFPDEAAIFAACTAHWLTLNPPPGRDQWSGAPEGEERVMAALGAWYDYYARTAAMWRRAYRDLEEVEALQEPMARVAEHLGSVTAALAAEIRPAPPQPAPLAASIRHLLDFRTWSGLGELGLDRTARLDLARRWIAGCRQVGGRPG